MKKKKNQNVRTKSAFTPKNNYPFFFVNMSYTY